MDKKTVYQTLDMDLKPKETDIQAVDYSEDELQYRSMWIRRLEQAVNQRNQPWSEFNDQTYDEWYISNAKAGNAYMEPKKNRHDSRTVTGTTREKKNTLIASLLNYNLEPDIEAFDEWDLPVVELGNSMEDMVLRSRQIESPSFQMKRELIYNELFEQGTVFVMEKVSHYLRSKKTLTGKFNPKKLSDLKWTQRIERIEKVLEVEMLAGPMVYLGNMKEFFIELQPYVALRRVRTRQEAQSLYGDWERFENVPFKLVTLDPQADSVAYVGDGANTYQNWRMVEIDQDLCEEVWVFDKWNNEWQIFLNGVMMLPIRFPLSELVGESEYPIAKGDLEPISRFFAYSRSVPSKTKVNQGLIDEMLKAIVLKTRKSYQPPIGNMTGQTLPPKVWFPGTVLDNVDASKIIEIGQNNGVTGSELQAFQLVKQIIDENSVNPIFEGQQSGGSTTAREVMQMQQQSLMRLGLTLYSVVEFEKKLAWLRLKNILKNWAEPLDESFEETKDNVKKSVKKYRTETVGTTFEDGQKGVRAFEFTDKPLPDESQVMAEEDILSDLRGVPVRKVYFNVEEFKNLKYKWYIEINPQPKDTNELKAAVFLEQVTQGFQLFGPESFNMENLKQQWAVLNRMNPEKVLAKPQQLPQPMGMPPEGGAPQGQPQASSQLMPKPMPSPSVNAMAQG